MKYWKIVANNLKRRGWSLGYVSVFDREEPTICIVDAHRDNGKRFIVRADEKLTDKHQAKVSALFSGSQERLITNS